MRHCRHCIANFHTFDLQPAFSRYDPQRNTWTKVFASRPNDRTFGLARAYPDEEIIMIFEAPPGNYKQEHIMLYGIYEEMWGDYSNFRFGEFLPFFPGAMYKMKLYRREVEWPTFG